MGCDIHLHQEVKIDGTWHHYGAPNIPRNYSLFGKMVGVRKPEVGPIAKPKGLPDDITFLTKFDWERDREDWHTPSWLNAEEITALEMWVNQQMGGECWRLEREYWGYLYENGWGYFNQYRQDYQKGLEDVRFVFWFDN